MWDRFSIATTKKGVKLSLAKIVRQITYYITGLFTIKNRIYVNKIVDKWSASPVHGDADMEKGIEPKAQQHLERGRRHLLFVLHR